MSSKFLTAEWSNLIMASYCVDPFILLPYLPSKTELDNYNQKVYVSLVGFMFNNVKIRGFKIPFHVNFPEINLRFYVRYKDNKDWKRGVVFIKEIVPKPAITFVANTMYNERYVTMRMKNFNSVDADGLKVAYQWKHNNAWNEINVNAGNQTVTLKPGSEEEFITEHFWGYSRFNGNKTAEYNVEHARWVLYPVNNHVIKCDFAALYGKDFSCLQNQVPDSVLLAKGSPVVIYNKRIITDYTLCYEIGHNIFRSSIFCRLLLTTTKVVVELALYHANRLENFFCH